MSSKKQSNTGGGDSEPPPTDPRLPFSHYREIFTLRNYWKTVQRNKDVCAKTFLFKFLAESPAHRAAYASRLADVDWGCEEAAKADAGPLHALALRYVDAFDAVVAELDAAPSNADAAIALLRDAAARHKARTPAFDPALAKDMEPAFLFMISEILGDRFNDKAEGLFRKFFGFCVSTMSA